ncbi:hypothetical protein [Butyrivibrio sp. AE3009]|uniref:hypothetical protein n=1 Tax=Butyrivibrio sp. AE3009 TaxID=1280666 RepID=UPI0003B789A6|nr:hypothetical protein [Butyrivibrio sp. AE3009]
MFTESTWGLSPLFDYPQVTFEPQNLVLACPDCNGFLYKHDKNTVITTNSKYKDWEFSIVHPYFDDPSDYYDYKEEQIIIRIKNGISPKMISKAKYTCYDLFDLNSEYMLTMRQALSGRKALDPDGSELDRLIQEALDYKKTWT